uniref:Leucine-rich repeat protein n=1 Tax=Paramoeba aestuarina TaxID=180227 RepID=A0A7S4KNG2_9EUKA
MDPSVGKIDKSSFDQQTLMEILINGIENPNDICGSKDSPKEIAKWRQIVMNYRHEVTDIDWSLHWIHGTIPLEWLPSTIITLKIHRNALSGSLNLTHLPPCMTRLTANDNQFRGEISLESLPDTLEELNVSCNELSGTINVTKLPQKLNSLFLHRNAFHGKTNFSQLQKSLRTFFVSDTNLSGDLRADWGQLYAVKNSQVRLHRV